MTRKIFLDMGSHWGETLRGAVQFDFDVVHGFEPSEVARKEIVRAVTDARVVVHPFGLAALDGEQKLYMSELTSGASLYAGKRNVDPEKFEVCQFRRVSSWIKSNVTDNDLVICKINVEGAEIEILRDLEQSGLIGLFRRIVFYPDIKKIPELAASGLAELARITAQYDNVESSVDAFVGISKDPQRRIRTWIQREFPEMTRIS